MKKTIHSAILMVGFILTVSAGFAIEINHKFGKVSTDELSTSVCPIDSNAHSYYLFDEGQLSFIYNEGFETLYERHFRIKILDKSGFENGEIKIFSYDNNNAKELVRDIKGCTYNYEDGKVVKSQLKGSEIFEEKTNKYFRQTKFALPNVKEGSVIEVRYTISSNRLWQLPEWHFQSDIPILESSYTIGIPDYFHYNQLYRGWSNVETKKSTQSNNAVQGGSAGLTFLINTFEYTAKNVPAFPMGEQLTTPENYICKIEFELSSFNVPGQVYKDYTTTWDDVVKLFLDDDDFGYKLKNSGFWKDQANQIVQSTSDKKDQMWKAFSLIQSSMKWDGKNSCWASEILKKSYESGTGNAADINLNLVALLKQIGLDAYPIVLSTRSNGMIHPVHASISQFDYVVAACKIDSLSFLMDATDKYSDIDVLPIRCLNGEGRIIHPVYSGWESLLRGKSSRSTTLYNLKIDDQNRFSGEVDFVCRDFDALETRNQIMKFNSSDEFIRLNQEQNPGLSISSSAFTNLDTTGTDLKYHYDIQLSDKVEQLGDLLYFNPLLLDAYTKNPFSLEKREYPIEYPYPFSETVIVNITLPEGYRVESLPAQVTVSSVEKDCAFTFRSGVVESKINIVSTLSVKNTFFSAQRYGEIRGFFERVVEKHLEKVVLKKI